MSHVALFSGRPRSRVLPCLFVLGLARIAYAQVPAVAPTKDQAQPAAKADAEQTGDGPLVNINDFETRPLTSGSLAGYTLERCIALTLRNYPRIHEARARLEYRRGQQA